jgi:RHS repeat-associated protein
VEIVQKATRTVRYRQLDRLGSLEAATTETGVEDTAYEHGFDAFGSPRSRDWQSSGDQMGQTDERGFTGHEHLDNLRLIHMNGRVYDYKLGRFLSVDPIISNPADSQSINPYSYIGNNPLSGVDPTGYEASHLSPAVSACGSNVGSHCDTIQISQGNASDRNVLVAYNGKIYAIMGYTMGTFHDLDQAMSAANQAMTPSTTSDGRTQGDADAPSSGTGDSDGNRIKVIDENKVEQHGAHADEIRGVTKTQASYQLSEADARAKSMLQFLNPVSKDHFVEFGGLLFIDMRNHNALDITLPVAEAQGKSGAPDKVGSPQLHMGELKRSVEVVEAGRS